MEYYYEESRGLYQKIHAQDPSKPHQFDQDLWTREKAASLASFIMGIAGIEAFANNVLRDFSVRKKEDLPKNLLNRSQRKRDINYWRLVDKVYFLPALCNTQLVPPAFYFKKDSRAFQLFQELVDIRNSIMHGRPERILVLVSLKPNKMHKMREVKDEFPENFWPISKIGKDFTSFNFECAKIAYDNTTWVRDSLVGFLEKVDKNYMKEERIKYISPIISDSEADRSELLTNWRKYVRNDQ